MATISGANINEETGSKQSCAACKYRRNKCTPETCMLCPYFPLEKTQDFNAVNKFFGLSNLTDLIKNLAVEDRERTVESFVWVARAWNQNPNTGPLGLYMDLAQECQRINQENQRLKQEIQYLKTVDVTNSDPMPINSHQGNGMYYDDQCGLDSNFGKVQQRFNQDGMDYQMAGLADQMDITQNTSTRRD